MASNLALLLQVARSAQGVLTLLEHGLELSQIAQLLQHAKSSGFLEVVDERLTVTSAGEEILAKSATLEEGGGWIRPADKYRVPAVDQDTVFLPELPPGKPQT